MAGSYAEAIVWYENSIQMMFKQEIYFF
jgi:hypothetical protein